MGRFQRKPRAAAVGILAMLIAMAIFVPLSNNKEPGVEGYPVPAVASLQSTKTGEGFLRVAMQDDMKTTNTVIAQDVWDWNVLGWLMDGPVNRQKVSKQPFPWMAESWEYDPADPLHGTMTLRKGIYWTDHNFSIYGDSYPARGYVPALDSVPAEDDPAGFYEVTAYDVVFSLNLINDAPRYQNSVDALRFCPYENEYLGVTVVDRYTVEYTLAHPVSDFVTEILGISVWPQHIWKNHLYDKLTWQPEVDEVVYCGMFILDTWDKGNLVKLITNEHYFNKSAIPNIDGIIFKIFGNTDLAILALQSDEIDYIAWTIIPGYIPTIQENDELALAQTLEMGFTYQSFNFRNPAFGYDNFTSPDRNDVGKPLRIAIAHCTNKEKIVLNFLQRKGTVGDSVVSPANVRYYNASVDKYPFDPEKAKQVLDAAGYYKVNGWYVSPDGSPIDGPDGDGVIEIIHPPSDYDPYTDYTDRMIADQLTAIGVRAENKPVDFGTLVTATNNHDFEMFRCGWSIESDDAGYMFDFFRTDTRDTIGGYNSPGYRNASYDAIVDAMVQEINVTKRIELAKRAQGIIAQDNVYSVLYYRDNLEAYRISNFKTGWWEQTGGIFNQWTIMELSTGNFPPMEVKLDGPERLNAPTTYAVTVVDKATSLPIEGASVKIISMYGHGELSPKTGTTDASGRFTFTFLPDAVAVDTGEVLVADVTCDGRFETTDSISIVIKSPDAFWLETEAEVMTPTPVDFSEGLELGIPIEVRVADGHGSWLEGAEVRMTCEWTPPGTFDQPNATTDAEGVASFVFWPYANQSSNRVYGVIAEISYLYAGDGLNYIGEEELSVEVLVVPKEMRVRVAIDYTSAVSGESLLVTVTVTDTSYAPVEGASVVLGCDAPSWMVEPAVCATNAVGKAEFTLIVGARAAPTLTATVTKEHYANNTARVTVKTPMGEDAGEVDPFDPIILYILLASVIVLAVVAVVAIMVMGRR